MVNVKTPNKKRKSMANAEGGSPAVAKTASPLKTPGKGKGNASPAKNNKTPQNNAKTPKGGAAGIGPKTPKHTPFKNQEQASGKKNNLNKRGNNAETESTPPKKIKMFAGTSEIAGSPSKEKQVKGGKQQGKKPQNENADGKKKRRSQFINLKDKVKQGDKSVATELEQKIKVYETRPDLTKTGKRKLKLLQRLLSVVTGKTIVKAPTDSKKRRERKKEAIVKSKTGGGNKQPKTEDVNAEEDDSDESDDEVEAEINPNKLIKTGDVEEESDDDDDDEEGDDEESGEEEESDDDDEDDDDEEEEETVVAPKGGKKKGQEKKNEVKVKNFKLQAMRKQGQLAGSIKETNKRSARRGKQNVKPNGSN